MPAMKPTLIDSTFVNGVSPTKKVCGHVQDAASNARFSSEYRTGVRGGGYLVESDENIARIIKGLAMLFDSDPGLQIKKRFSSGIGDSTQEVRTQIVEHQPWHAST
jgi:hypothetical protein